MSLDELEIARMLSTRLCHDITGPIGAVNNGVEFLEDGEDDGMYEGAMDLIASSAKEAVARLQFYRQAYGRIGDDGLVCIDERKEFVEAFLVSSKAKLEWNESPAKICVPPIAAQLLLNMFILAAGVLLRGGIIRLNASTNDNGGYVFDIQSIGSSLKFDDEVSAVLMGTSKNITPKTVQAFLTARLATSLNCSLDVSLSDDFFSIKSVCVASVSA